MDQEKNVLFKWRTKQNDATKRITNRRLGEKPLAAVRFLFFRKNYWITFRTCLEPFIRKNQITKIGSYLKELNCPAPSTPPYLQVKSEIRLNAGILN